MNRIKIRYTIAFKLGLYITTCVVVISLLALLYNYKVSKDTIMDNIKNDSKDLSFATLDKMGSYLVTAQQISQDIANVLESCDFTLKDIMNLLKNEVKACKEVYGCTIAFEPYMFNKTKYYFDPYFYKPEGVVKYFDIDNDEEYNYFKWDWYTIPKKLNRGIWSEPYFDKGGGNIYMVTYSKPFYKTIDGKKKFCGVVACDIDLTFLERLVNSIKIFNTGYAFILSPKGFFIEHKNNEYTKSKESIFSLAESKENIKLKKLGEKMISKQTGFEEYYSYTLRKKCFVSYAPLETTGWSIGIVIPDEELFFDLNTATWKLFIAGVVSYIFILILIITLASKMMIPLRTLVRVTNKIGKGDFHVSIPVNSSTDEVGVLSRTFQRMQENLVKHITDLQETTAAKEKIEKELSIAREIQQNLLPQTFPCLKQIDLYATLIPAREIGGDLYDFFFIDEKHLCFAIGDVAGKGVPAALFMAVVKTLLRAKINLTIDPAKVFTAMNEDLCKDNKSYMFVTFFLGILNIETGLLEYCNAGHNPPLIHTAQKGFYYFHTENPHSPLGIGADVNYVGNRLKLLPEDIFFLYTDGVTEAMNIDEIQFSEEKLIDILVKNKDETVSDIINNVKMAVAQHALDRMQSDDITMLILKYNG